MATGKTPRLHLLQCLCLILICIKEAYAPSHECDTYRQPVDGNADTAGIVYTGEEITYTCLPGYYDSSGDDERDVIYKSTCVDIDGYGTPGWSSGECADIDECDTVDTHSDVDHECDVDAKCYNTPGSYICVCNEGHTGDGFDGECTRVTCPDLTHVPHALVNVPAFSDYDDYEDEVVYTCDDGYMVDNALGLNEDTKSLYGYTDTSFRVTCKANRFWSIWPLPHCVPVDCGDPGVLLNALRSAGEFTYPSALTYTCNDGYRLTPTDYDSQSFTITCRSDGNWDGLQQCIDIDECKESKDSCHEDSNSECTNIPGTYICRCREGYTGDGKTCTRVPCYPLPPLPHAQPISVVPSSPVYEDKVQYACNEGYHVLQQSLYDSYLPNSYGYYHSSFHVTCTATGQWDHIPLPVCVPVDCGDPGILYHASRTGSDFTYGHEVHYQCLEGFYPGDTSLGRTGFSTTCGKSGTWSKTTECVDVDECTESRTICGGDTNYCLNTPGSYMCSCVPWYMNSPDDNRCLEWPGLAAFQSNKPCDIVRSLRLCINGDCELQSGQAVCRCSAGYEGVACDRPVISTALIIAIIGMVLMGFVLILIIVVSFCTNLCKQAAHHPHLHQPQSIPEPTYGRYAPHQRGQPWFLGRKGPF